jgi:hypothetical protein
LAVSEHYAPGVVNTHALTFRASRRLWAMFWLRLLLPGGPGERRNPPGTADTQAQRLLELLDAS